jgi:hypothetical protein
MSRGSITLQMTNSYGSLLTEKFQIEKVARLNSKVMLTTGSGPTGFAAVTALESECKFNTGYSVGKMLTLLFE